MDLNELLIWNNIQQDLQDAEEDLIIGREVLLKRDPFNTLSDRKFIQNFRLTKELCREVIDLVTPFIEQPNRRSALPVKLKVLAALKFYGFGSYQEITGSNAYIGISQASVSRSIEDVTNALNEPEIMNAWIHFPRNMEELESVRTRFYEKYHFPGVIGCIDCTHIAIIAPPVNHPIYPEHIYVNRKHYHSLNVQLICDCDLKIMNINAQFPGSTHDAHIWRTSRVSQVMEGIYRRDPGNVFFLIGDS
ncbi:putative nuclease HARBI1, partial [Anoplophora glabripennis]